MTDEAMLTELQGLLERATPGGWSLSMRRDDADAPASIVSGAATGRAYAVAMCPRFGLTQFKADAALIAALRNAAPRLMELAQCAQEAKRILDALHAAYALHEDDNEVAAEACKWLDRWGAKP